MGFALGARDSVSIWCMLIPASHKGQKSPPLDAAVASPKFLFLIAILRSSAAVGF